MTSWNASVIKTKSRVSKLSTLYSIQSFCFLKGWQGTKIKITPKKGDAG